MGRTKDGSCTTKRGQEIAHQLFSVSAYISSTLGCIACPIHYNYLEQDRASSTIRQLVTQRRLDPPSQVAEIQGRTHIE